MKPKVIFYTFGSEGPPHDEGLPLFSSCGQDLMKNVLESGVDEAYCISPRTLIDFIGPEKASRAMRIFKKPFKEMSKSYYKVGMGAWKAEILKEAARRNRDGDIIMFHDINWKKYGFLKGFGKNARDYATAAVSICDIFAPVHLTLNHTLTRRNYENLRDKTLPETKSSRVASMPSARARCIVIRLNPNTRDFIERFSAACDEDEMVYADGNRDRTGGWIQKGYLHNAGEQGVLNGLLYGRGIWDAKRDRWINDLQGSAFKDRDTGFRMISKWAAKHKSWKSDK